MYYIKELRALIAQYCEAIEGYNNNKKKNESLLIFPYKTWACLWQGTPREANSLPHPIEVFFQ